MRNPIKGSCGIPEGVAGGISDRFSGEIPEESSTVVTERIPSGIKAGIPKRTPGEFPEITEKNLGRILDRIPGVIPEGTPDLFKKYFEETREGTVEGILGGDP